MMRGKWFWIAAALGTVALRSQALTLSVSPSEVGWDSNAWVEIAISNLTPGASAQLVLLVDADRTRSLTLADRPLASFSLTDGVTYQFGAAYMPSDRDGASNGVIVTRISYHGLDSALHTIGSYLWLAATNPSMPVAQPFAVVQATSTVWITGTVRDIAPPHHPIAAARVQLATFSLVRGFEPAVWTDTNGCFRLDLPPGVSTSDVRGVLAIGASWMGAVQAPDGQWVSVYPFWEPLSQGENVLTNSLFLTGPIPGQLYVISGRLVQVVGTTTNPVPWTLISTEIREEGEEEGPDIWTCDITKDDGGFRLIVPGHVEVTLFVSPNVNQRGWVTELLKINVGTQDIKNVTIQCRPATALARGRVESADLGTPVEGCLVYMYDVDLQTYGFGYTMENGYFEIGVVAGSNYVSGSMEEDQVWRLGYVPPEAQGPFVIGTGEIFTNAVFVLEPASVIGGRVFSRQTNALREGYVLAFPTGSWDVVSQANVNLNGEYELPVPTGVYRLQATGFSGYLPLTWSNHFQWEWDNGPVYDPVAVTTGDVAGIDFYLPEAAYIRGTVRGNGAPLKGVEVRAILRSTNWAWRGSGSTAPDGTYEIAVLGGTSYVVEASPPSDTFWIRQFYSNVLHMDEATLVPTETGSPATNINFNLPKGGRVEGWLFDTNGITAFTSAVAVVAGWDMSNNWINGQAANPVSGQFRITLPAGLYRIRAEAFGWLPQYYGGYFDHQWWLAPTVTVAAEQVTGSLSITMALPSYVEGVVRAGGSPVSNMPVELVYIYDTNLSLWAFIAGDSTRHDGRYVIAALPGNNFAVRVLPPGGSGFTEQWWSNAPSVSAATLLSIGRQVTISNINFDLAAGMRIMGRATDETGAPLAGALIQAWRVQGNSWYWAGEANTDSNGNYVLTVAAVTSYVVSLNRPWGRPFEQWWYPTLYFSNALLAQNACVVWTNLGGSVTGVDFRAQSGFHLTGRVIRAQGGAPITNADAQVFYNDTLSWLMENRVNDQGEFRFCVPTNWPLFVRAQASGYGIRWHSNTFSSAAATPVWGVSYTRVNVEFRLGAYNEDLDGDGFDEYAETRVLFTDPLDANDYLRMAQAVRTSVGVEIRWMSRLNVNYWVERSQDLQGGHWVTLAGPIAGTGGMISVTDTNAPAKAVYKIVVPSPDP